jgi:hypothetical protein
MKSGLDISVEILRYRFEFSDTSLLGTKARILLRLHPPPLVEVKSVLLHKDK